MKLKKNLEKREKHYLKESEKLVAEQVVLEQIITFQETQLNGLNDFINLILMRIEDSSDIEASIVSDFELCKRTSILSVSS
jgi:hypothetical protein